MRDFLLRDALRSAQHLGLRRRLLTSSGGMKEGRRRSAPARVLADDLFARAGGARWRGGSLGGEGVARASGDRARYRAPR